MKVCNGPKCKGTTRQVAEFHKSARSKSGLQAWCKTCASEAQATRKLLDPGKSAADAKARRVGHRTRWEREDPRQRPGTKRCRECRGDLPRTSFALALNTKDGLQGWCAGCRRQYYISNVKAYLVKNASDRAKRKGLEFSLQLEDFEIPEICPVLGIRLEVSPGRRDASPSLDRMDNSKGYTQENAVVVSWRANRLKSDATEAELAAVLAYVRRLRASS